MGSIHRKYKGVVLAVLGAAAIALTGCGSSSSGGGFTQPSKSLTSISISPANPTVPLGDKQQFTATGFYSDGSKQDLTQTVSWSSSQSGIAAIAASGLASSKQIGKTSINANSGSISGSTTLAVSQAALVSLSVSPKNPTVPKGETQQLTATGTFSDGSTQDVTGSVAWSSSAAGVASISNGGLATAQAAGTATLVATSGSITGQDTLTVSAAALMSITLSPLNPTVPKGETQQLAATGIFSDGSTQNLTNSVSWISSPPGIVAINSGGVATAQATGTATLIASAGTVSGQDLLTVSQAALLSLAVSPANPTVPKGETQQLTATGTLSDGSTQDMTSAVAWTSSPPGLVSLTSGGLATAQATGTANLVATSGSITGQDTLTVSQAVLMSLAITPLNPSIPKGETQQLTAIGTYSDGTTQDLTNSVAWIAALPAVASVTNTGFLTAQTQGATTITASASSVSAMDGVVVAAPVVMSIAVSPTNVSTPLGFQQPQFTAMATFSDGSQQDLTSTATWATDSPQVATIDSSGLATTVGVGTANVSAASGSVTGSTSLNVTPSILFHTDYFSYANATGYPDATVSLSNTNLDGNNICAMIYVFDQNEAMTECCGCSASIDDLRTLSVNNDLTANPLTGRLSTRGTFKIVPADSLSNPTCNPSTITAGGELDAWTLHLQSPTAMSESTFPSMVFTSAEQSFLQDTCAAIQELGTGQGICTCGTGD